MTLHDFMLLHKKRLEEFGIFWTRNCTNDLPTFPMTLDQAQWEEQFMTFLNIPRSHA